jgi:acetyl-CoA C-acetyltransferase
VIKEEMLRKLQLNAQLCDHLSAVSLNRYCASGLEAVNQAAAMIKSGWSDLIIAGGVESMS